MGALISMKYVLNEGIFKNNSRVAEIIVEKCGLTCPYFYAGDGRGMCDDWADCKKYSKRLSEYRNDCSHVNEADGFPSFCELKKL